MQAMQQLFASLSRGGLLGFDSTPFKHIIGLLTFFNCEIFSAPTSLRVGKKDLWQLFKNAS
jgi:hypothetical protein